mgnify:CR=1 FL=1
MRNIKTSKILYVEDDAEAAELCRVILNDQGYEVAIADTGKLGLEMYRDGDFDESHPWIFLAWSRESTLERDPQTLACICCSTSRLPHWLS